MKTTTKKQNAAGHTRRRYRSAITGRLIKKTEADASPSTTVSLAPKRRVSR